jgi:hypothetical protein
VVIHNFKIYSRQTGEEGNARARGTGEDRKAEAVDSISTTMPHISAGTFFN